MSTRDGSRAACPPETDPEGSPDLQWPALVKEDWLYYTVAPPEWKRDRELLLSAVKQEGTALQYAPESHRSDREVVLAAVKQDGLSLEYAAAPCKSDREIVLAASTQNVKALQYACDALLEDTTFATEAKEKVCVIKVSMMSGRSCCLTVLRHDMVEVEASNFVMDCCERLEINCERLARAPSVCKYNRVSAGSHKAAKADLAPVAEPGNGQSAKEALLYQESYLQSCKTTFWQSKKFLALLHLSLVRLHRCVSWFFLRLEAFRSCCARER
eukprot:3217409-Amphidinium_carterae.1